MYDTDNEVRRKAIGLARYAEDFFRAALAADDLMGADTDHEIYAPVPVQFLLAHAIELILNSFLNHQRISLSNLDDLVSGDLVELLNHAISNGLDPSTIAVDADQQTLAALSEIRRLAQLTHLQRDHPRFPAHGPATGITKLLLDTISPIVGYRQKL